MAIQREQQHSHHLYFFCRCEELVCQTFLKAGRQNCNNVFRPKEMNSSLCLFNFERRNVEIFKKQSLHYELRHVSVITTAASRKTRLDAIMIGRCQGYCRLSTNGKRGIHFFQRCLQPLYLSRPPSATQ